MVAQHRLRKPLGLAALEFVFAAEARELGEPDGRLPWTEKLNLLDAHAVGEKRVDHAGPIEHLEHRGLKRGSARLVMGREPLLDDPRLHAVTEELASGEKARWTRADDEDPSIGRRVVSLFGPRRHSGSPRVFCDYNSRRCGFATTLRCTNFRTGFTRSAENLVEPIQGRARWHASTAELAFAH
jgi:hypothetical protein